MSPTRRRRTASPDRSPISPWLAVGLAAAVYLAAAIAAVIVPQRIRVHDPRLADVLRRGPASYFHHFFDPQGLLGEVGELDLKLDILQRTAAHQVVVGALQRLPGGDPFFTTKLAEWWQVGGPSDDGVLLFIFPQDRRVRADVGYGLEDLLPDATMRAILADDLLPACQRGDCLAGLTSSVQRLSPILESRPGRRPRAAGLLTYLRPFFADLPGFARQAADAWLGAPLRARLLMDLLVVVLGAAVVATAIAFGRLFAALARACVLTVRLGSWREAVAAGGALWGMIYYAAGAIAILIFAAAGTTYYFGGSGRFGGGGVDLLW